MLPGANQVHYPALAKIVREAAKEHGVEYLCLDTFGEALGSHINYLHTLGQEKGE